MNYVTPPKLLPIPLQIVESSSQKDQKDKLLDKPPPKNPQGGINYVW